MVYTRKTAPGRGGAGGGKKFGSREFKPRYGGDRDSFGGPPQMHKATCAECGNECQVPFKPNGRKPIFCTECFKTKEGGENYSRPERSFRKPSFDRPSFGPKRSFDAAPRSDEQTEKRFEEVNMKLDRILRELAALKDDKE